MKNFFFNPESRLRASLRMLILFVGWNIILIMIAHIILISLKLKNAWGFGAAGMVYILGGLNALLIWGWMKANKRSPLFA